MKNNRHHHNNVRAKMDSAVVGVPQNCATEYAILVRNARKCYQSGKPILNNLNMSVKEGTIYGFLGASGCGKTTMLSCIAGLRTLDSGTIEVFGHKPGSPESGIPGRTLGYMPQEVALYNALTIREILHYFGKIYEMTKVEVEARMEFLIKFLHLPDSNSRVANLSGGEQRRVSFSISMLHHPKVLILDEPTASIDPLLRTAIWEHLREIVTTHKTTVIITTHFIEETKDADTVAIMRSGKILVEKAPNVLLEEYQTMFLEKVFLQLCVDDENGCIPANQQISKINNSERSSRVQDCESGSKSVNGIAYHSNTEENVEFSHHRRRQLTQNHGFVKKCFNHADKIIAVLIKNFLTLIRNPVLMFAVFFIPPLNVFTFNMILGHDPSNIPLGLIDQELPQDNLLEYCKAVGNGCFPNGTSCQYINTFSEKDIIWKVFKTKEEALESVQLGNTWGWISFPQNYTQHMIERSLVKNYIGNETLEGSTITGRLDMSLNVKSDFVLYKAFSNFQTYISNIATNCKTDPRAVEVPLKFNAVFGNLNSTFIQYMQPGQLILTIILLPMAAALQVLQDRKAGTLQRSVVAGLQYTHTLIAFMIGEGLILVIQVGLCYFGVMYLIFGTTVEGPLFQFLLLVFLVGMAGLCIGFLIGQLVDHEVEGVFIALGIYLPLMVSSGSTWPSEGMPELAKIIYTSSPTAMPIKALRAIFTRGWGWTHPQVFAGFAVVLGWIAILCIISTIVTKIRNK